MTRARNPRRGAARGRGGARRVEPAAVRFYPNDPDASVGLVPTSPPARDDRLPRYVIEGRRYAPAPYAPGTLAFQYWQGEIALARTIRVWEDAFERDFTAWQAGRPLRVRLRAGRDLNAFYDRASLQFFFDVDRQTGRTVYAAESLDIVAHEAGHAILDVYQPGFWSTPDLETAAFHEAFADCSALLATLTEPAVRRAFLSEAGGARDRSNLVSRLAEALGRALHHNHGPEVVSDPTRLRDAKNSFRYVSPARLRSDRPDTALAAEPHSFSRVFTGAFYDLWIELVARSLPRGGAGEEHVEGARRLAGRLLARAVETLPPGEARYRSVALRMRAIDEEEEGGVARDALERAFERHGIRLTARRAGVLAGRAGARPRHAPPTGGYRALRALDPDRPGGMAALRAALGLGPRARLERRGLLGRPGERGREQLLHHETVRVRHRSLGSWSGLAVRVACGCTLTRDAAGDVEGASLTPRAAIESDALAARISPWLALGAIARGEEAGRPTRELFRARKAFRLTGEGILERVYFDGGRRRPEPDGS